MRKSIKTILGIGLLLVLLLSIPVSAEEQVEVLLNGSKIEFADQKPVIINGRTLVPLRGVLEAMGVTVGWIDETQTATAEKDGIKITLTIDDPTLYKNGEAIVLDVPAQLINSRTMVPARAVSESFGARVGWFEAKSQVVISTDNLLNQALSAIDAAKSYYFSATTTGSYLEGMTFDLSLSLGSDLNHSLEISHYSIDAAFSGEDFLNSFETIAAGKEKSYFLSSESSSQVTNTPASWSPAPLFPAGTPFLLEKEDSKSVTYQMLDGSDMCLVVDKKTATPTHIYLAKENLSNLIALPDDFVFEKDLSGALILNGNQVKDFYEEVKENFAK